MTKMAQFAECTKKSNKLRAIKAAFLGFGEVNTPREIIERKCRNVREQIEAHGIEIIWTNPVTDDREGRDVAKARRELANKNFDFLIVCVAGWIPSHAVIAVIDEYRHKPMLLLGLTGW
jgi:sugar phosphate isomerase/epimerase